MSGPYIIRAPRPARGYEILPHGLLRDVRLSLRAIGLAARLLSNADGYRMPMTAIAAEGNQDGSNREGRDAIRAAFRELLRAGYAVQRRSQDAQGRWRTDTWIYDTPQPKTDFQASVPAEPKPEKPGPGNPDFGGGGAISRTTSTTSSKTTTTTTTDWGVSPSRLVEGLLTQAGVVVVRKIERSALPPDLRRQVLAEIVGQMRAGAVRRPAAFAAALVSRAAAGAFELDAGQAIEADIQRRVADAVAAVARAKAAAEKMKPELTLDQRKQRTEEARKELGL